MDSAPDPARHGGGDAGAPEANGGPTRGIPTQALVESAQERDPQEAERSPLMTSFPADGALEQRHAGGASAADAGVVSPAGRRKGGLHVHTGKGQHGGVHSVAMQGEPSAIRSANVSPETHFPTSPKSPFDRSFAVGAPQVTKRIVIEDSIRHASAFVTPKDRGKNRCCAVLAEALKVDQHFPSTDLLNRPYYRDRPPAEEVSRRAALELSISKRTLSLQPEYFRLLFFVRQATHVYFFLRFGMIVTILSSITSLASFASVGDALLIIAVPSAIVVLLLLLTFLKIRHFQFFARQPLIVIWIFATLVLAIAIRYQTPSDHVSTPLMVIISFNLLTNIIDFVPTISMLLCIAIGHTLFTALHPATFMWPGSLWALRIMYQALYLGIPTLWSMERLRKDCFVAHQKALGMENEQHKKNILIENLLDIALPKTIISQLQEGKRTAQFSRISSATILFFSLRNFETLTSSFEPTRIVDSLNQLFGAMDQVLEIVCARFDGLEKIKTIGNTYMAAAGLLEECDHAHIVAVLAVKLLLALKRNTFSCGPLACQAGFQSGTVYSGIIGISRPMFDTWGDPVNLASRLQNLCPDDGIATTVENARHLSSGWRFRSLGTRNIKGKGDMEIALLLGSRDRKYDVESLLTLPGQAQSKASTTTQSRRMHVSQKEIPMGGVADSYGSFIGRDDFRSNVRGSIVDFTGSERGADAQEGLKTTLRSVFATMQGGSQRMPTRIPKLQMAEPSGASPALEPISKVGQLRPAGRRTSRSWFLDYGFIQTEDLNMNNVSDRDAGKMMDSLQAYSNPVDSKNPDIMAASWDRVSTLTTHSRSQTGDRVLASARTPFDRSSLFGSNGLPESLPRQGSPILSINRSRRPSAWTDNPDPIASPMGSVLPTSFIRDGMGSGAGPTHSTMLQERKKSDADTAGSTDVLAARAGSSTGKADDSGSPLNADGLLVASVSGQGLTQEEVSPDFKSWSFTPYRLLSNRAQRLKAIVTTLGVDSKIYLRFLLIHCLVWHVIVGVCDAVAIWKMQEMLAPLDWRLILERTCTTRAAVIVIQIPLIICYWKLSGGVVKSKKMESGWLAGAHKPNEAGNRDPKAFPFAASRDNSTHSLPASLEQKDRNSIKLGTRIKMIQACLFAYVLVHIAGDQIAATFLYALRDKLKVPGADWSDPLNGYREAIFTTNGLVVVGTSALTVVSRFALILLALVVYGAFFFVYGVEPLHGDILPNFFVVAATLTAMIFVWSSENSAVQFFRFHDLTLLKAEHTIKQQTRAEALLNAVLPASVANRHLFDRHAVIVDVGEVTVVVMDIASFTEVSQNYSPEDLVMMLNFLFSRFDADCNKFGLEKICTIGDSYVALANLPSKQETYTVNALRVALRMIQHAIAFQDCRREKEADLAKQLAASKALGLGIFIPGIRVGVASGKALAALVGGTIRFRYDIQSEVMKRAKQLETASPVSYVNICGRSAQLACSMIQGSIVASEQLNKDLVQTHLEEWAHVAGVQNWEPSQDVPKALSTIKDALPSGSGSRDSVNKLPTPTASLASLSGRVAAQLNAELNEADVGTHRLLWGASFLLQPKVMEIPQDSRGLGLLIVS